MSKLVKIGYELSDVSIIQSPISPIRHRSECNPYRVIAGREMYPVIVSPMASVTNEHNYKKWLDNKFMCVVPRSVDINTRLNLMNEVFVSFSLDESENALLSESVINSMIGNDKKMYVCIDLAHGTMSALYDACKNLKKIYSDRIEIMTGNIATPDAYAFYVDAGIDYVRCFIGSGSRCFVKGTKVTMADGTLCNIEDIDVGDYVKTINGNYKVINVFENTTKETLIINNEVECTPNHKFLVVKNEDIHENMTDDDIKKIAFYIEASNLTEDYLLVMD